MKGTDQQHVHSIDCAIENESSKSSGRSNGTCGNSAIISISDAGPNRQTLTKAFASDTASLASPSQAKNNTRECILYLIRHGEAHHNVIEQTAMDQARSNSLNDGYGPESPETRRRMEEARRHAIEDSRLSNCPLSEKGREDAASAKMLLDKIIKENKDLPPPTEVIVSPLKRATQTAHIVFPNHNNIRIRKEVRERLTGKPCDSMNARWERKRRHSLKDLMHETSSVCEDNHRDRRLSISKLASYLKWGGSIVEEDNEMVRERIRTKLFALIEKSKHDSIALVTHKGTLRELERGPFGMVGAMEFGNGEVRVYRVRFSIEGEGLPSIDVDTAERIA